MSATLHPVVHEEIMALVDGELSSAEARTVLMHIDQCPECAKVAEQIRGVSQTLQGWIVAPAAAGLDDAVNQRAAEIATASTKAKPAAYIRASFWNWRLWAIGAGGAAAAVVAAIIFFSSVSYYSEHASRPMAQYAVQQDKREQGFATGSKMQTEQGGAGVAGSIAGTEMFSLAPPAKVSQRVAKGVAGMVSGPDATGARTVPEGPMIARMVSLTILVKDVSASRSALDRLLAEHQGYAARLSMNTPENAPRTFQASLRIPAPELSATLADLRGLGRVQSETQTGEEVTQQHADLVARLQNSRETEERLRAILQQRTGKIDEVLAVEEQIANVRGEIESMEAEQKTLEHRVNFASVDLQLVEEYTAQLNSASTSVSTRMHNALVAGIGNASGSVLAILLILEEFGPAVLVWLLIVGGPALFVWRRYRKARGTV